ncbi:MAG TPA: penicillin-binding protein 2 [Parvibaculum sp.]|jgi:cell division protein FtsI (penicillin-binding protein 3)
MIGRRNQQHTPRGRIVFAGHDAIAKPRMPYAGGYEEARTPSQRRIFLSLAVFAVGFSLVGARLVELAIVGANRGPHVAALDADDPIHRPDIVDRNGEVMATDIVTASLYADGRAIIDPVDTARQLAAALPDLNVEDVAAKLETGRAFIWLKRDLTPKQQYAVHYLGLPGLGFRREQKRVYPNGHSSSHVLGMVDLDNRGTAGMERYIDKALLLGRGNEGGDRAQPVSLSVDTRVQFALRDELVKGIDEFKAKAAVGIIMDAHTGELMALSSLPDFDPNDPMAASDDARFNRATLGVYELGSVFKAVTLASALDSGRVQIGEKFDATQPIKYGRFTIHDFHAENRWLSVPEVFMYSSNIGTAKIALQLGTDKYREYLNRFGLLSQPQIELPESGAPLIPARWGELSTVTVSFGQGIAVTPIQVVSALAAIVNGGTKVTPTFLRHDTVKEGPRLVSAEVSKEMRGLLRLVVTEGTGKKADVPGYPVMGKTGTAEKAVNGGYAQHRLISSFLSAFPANDPRYVMLIMFDEPQGSKATYGYATAGWNAAPVTARVVKRVAPLLGISPEEVPVAQNGMIHEAKLVTYVPGSGD